MPCFSMQSVTVQWTEKTSVDLLFKALEAAKLNPQRNPQGITFNNGQYNTASHTMTLQGGQTEQRTKQLKAGYSAQVAKDSFQKAGWVIKETPTAQVIMMRRS